MFHAGYLCLIRYGSRFKKKRFRFGFSKETFLCEIKPFVETVWLSIQIQILRRGEYGGIDQSALDMCCFFSSHS